MTFNFCEGGSYCDADFEESLPAGISISDGGSIAVEVATGFVPTTLVIEKVQTSYDLW